MSARYISPQLPQLIRDLYRADLREKSIQNMLDLAGDLVQELIDLRAEQGETEWEHSWGGDDWRLDMEFATERAAREFAARTPWVGKDGYLVRRRKAGAWEPVTNTESEGKA